MPSSTVEEGVPPPPPPSVRPAVAVQAGGGGFTQHALRQVELKPTTTARDSSAPQLATFAESAEDVRVYQNAVLDINIESWYPLIADFTFPTEFVPMTQADGQLFVDSYLAYEAHLKRQTTHGLPPSEFVPPPELVERAAAMAERLQLAVESVREAEGKPVFIKASSRSAKDAPTSQQRLGELYRERLAEFAVRAEPDDNAKLRCMLAAGLELMKAFGADDALALFLRSERIYQDMLLALERPERWDENFAVRQWVDIDVSMEFRGFVKGGRLCALSQYNHLCFFPELPRMKSALEAQIRKFYVEHIQSRLGSAFQDYVIDFAVTGSSGGLPQQGEQDFKIWVIELNPFMETTDGCLFSWSHERHILEGSASSEGGGGSEVGGSADDRLDPEPFEFRLVQSVIRGAKALVASDWRQLLESDSTWQAGGLRG